MLEIQLNIPGCAVQLRRIAPGRYSIGRGLGADIRLRHDSVARRHALLSVQDGETVVMDVGAADSIRRNGVVVCDTAPARSGDTFAIGDCELKVVRNFWDDPVDLPENTRLTVALLDSDDLSAAAIAELAQKDKAFDFLNDPREDVYMESDGKAV